MVSSAYTATILSLSKMRYISDFKTFSESCPFMVRDQTNMKNCIFNEDCPTDCKPEICPFIEEVSCHVLSVL